MEKTGVIHGRFQILHNDHLKYLLAGKARCKHLVVGITNPDPTLTAHDSAAPERGDQAANPLTYFERYTMVTAALLETKVAHETFSVVPFPINFPELYQYYVPLDAVFFMTIYDQWGRRKRELFSTMGLRVEILWEKPLAQKGLTASEIRKRLISGEPWEHLVPPAICRLIKDWNLKERLRELNASS
jgi:nicotinamide-nucleotide adenylyltransferase